MKSGKKGKKGNSAAGWIGGFSVPLVLIGLYLLLRNSTAASLWITNRISRPYRRFVGKLFSPLGFSVMELLCTLLVLWLIVYIIITIVKLFTGKHKIRTLTRRILTLILTASWIFVWYAWSYGFDYYIPGFAERNGLSGGVVTTEKLYDVTKMFAENASRLAPMVERDENGNFSAKDEEIFKNSAYIYKYLVEDFPDLDGDHYAPKGMFYSNLFSRMGFTGIYFPFTGECNINVDAPGSGRPFTIAHELAHSRGVASEDEANFVGIAACVSSDDVIYQYSGYLSGLSYLMNDLYRADRESWREIWSGLNEYIIHDMAESNAYWSDLESSVTAAAETMYNSYLLVGGDSRGMTAYDECVKLLVVYYSN